MTTLKSEPAVLIAAITALLVAVIQAVAANIDDPTWQNVVLLIVPVVTAAAGFVTRRFVTPEAHLSTQPPSDGRYDT